MCGMGGGVGVAGTTAVLWSGWVAWMVISEYKLVALSSGYTLARIPLGAKESLPSYG